ncbi:MAG: hypothetical protein IJ812_06835 [Schwartzia sp.]|nr:hypothetical protein [Schwartzia sp. (in: firmicutes)]MBR1759998.1 hypothetical protein [Schwartzia sp. (in: firmicutes)]MBR1886107.1 hypothetical protein [Schwartzia sp. (in: firmicutes)]
MLIGSVGLNSIANQVAQDGYSAAHASSKEASRNLSVSNFGSETKAGSSKFQQANEMAAQEGNRATAENMRETTSTFEQFEEKQSYTKNATLAAIRQNTMDISQ